MTGSLIISIKRWYDFFVNIDKNIYDLDIKIIRFLCELYHWKEEIQGILVIFLFYF